MTQQYGPQQQYPSPWGGQQQPQGWNRPQQSFGQPAWPQQPGGYPQGGRYQQPGGYQQPGYQQVPTLQPGGYPQRPGYQQPGQFNRAPQGRNPLSRILVTLVVLCGVLLAAIVVANMLGGSQGTSPQPQDTWSPPPPDLDPPDLPEPKTYGEATEWLQKNKVYNQQVAVPTACPDLQPIDAVNASESQLNTHLQDLTSCLVRVWQTPMQKAGFLMPRPPAAAYSQPIQTACGKLDDLKNAVYCGADQRIYYGMELPRIFSPSLRTSRFLMEMVLAHEFGHAIQYRTGIGISSMAWEQKATTKAAANVYSRRLEMQADCMAGIWVNSVGDSQGLSNSDLDALKQIAYNIGDDVLTGKQNIDEGHGLGATRQKWFETGLNANGDIGQCNTYTARESQVR